MPTNLLYEDVGDGEGDGWLAGKYMAGQCGVGGLIHTMIMTQTWPSGSIGWLGRGNWLTLAGLYAAIN